MSSSSKDMSSDEYKEYEDFSSEETESATNDVVDEDDLSSSSSFQEKSFDELRVRLYDITLATNNFSEFYVIGSGGYGKVYKAELKLDHLAGKYTSSIEGKMKGKLTQNVKTVAIKRIIDEEQVSEKFYAEIEMLISCKHPNIVSLLGYCDERHEMILVYEYMSNRSLNDYISSTNKMTNLTWAQRIRICLDIAHGLLYLHTSTDDKKVIVHRDVKSANILLDYNHMAKISDFEIAKLVDSDHFDNIIITAHIAGTEIYLDPEYMSTGQLSLKSDVYSFGVVMFEILCGKLAYDKTYGEKGLPSIARQCFNEGTLNNLIDPIIMKADENNSVLINRVDQDALNTFSKIAYECLSETQLERPTMEVIIKELEKALVLQTNNSFNAYQLEELLLATNNFSEENLITKGGLGNVYKGRLTRYRKMDLIVRKLDCKYGQGDELETEFSMLSSLKHKNIISTLGYCNEDGENIIIYKQAVHGSLDQYLSDPTIMTWSRRLQICLGVSRALNYIHYDVIHCDINNSKILLDEDWEPKIFGFELSTKYPQSWRHRLLFSGYFDKSNMTPKYDVYSFGVLLFEVLYGMKPMKTEYGVKVELDDIINPSLSKQMDRQSLDKFEKIMYKCLSENLVQRPTMDQIVKELEEVLELQWKHENLEHAVAYEDTSYGLLKMEWLEIPIRKIRSATEDFDEKKYSVGVGGFGMVYKATLDVLDIQNLPSMEGKSKDDLPMISKTVALKRIFQRQGDEQGKQGFVTEIELLTSCKHPNIVALLGFSTEDNEKILVYEYASNGSLSDYLGNTSKKINLTWARRIQICLDVAHGINYLHTNMEGKPRIIHRDIKSDNILLDENLNAKVADFGLSKFHFKNQQPSTIVTKIVAGTDYYVDPEYQTSGKYKKESDIYSFGVVLFEILSGRVAYDSTYTGENVKGLAPIARRRFNEQTLKELIDPKIIEEDDENIVTLNRGPNQESFKAFSRIANQCLAETQAKRPTMEDIIKELQNALSLQGETIVLSRFPRGDILMATENFSNSLSIGLHEYDVVYRAELDDFDNKSSLAFKEKNDGEWPKTRISVAIKNISSGEQVKQKFFSEIEMRTRYKHPNIVSLLGFSDEGDEMFLVYEHASKQSLDDYLKNDDAMYNLTWTERLNVCLAVARGLDHLHTKMDNQQRIKHGDLRSANILFGKNREPKIAYYGISEFLIANQEEATTKVYWSPDFEKTRTMKIESDIYSFGVILFEIFCGRLAYDPVYIANNDKGLAPIARIHFNDGTIKQIIDPKLLKEATDDDIFTSNSGPNQNSLDTFVKIAHQCLVEVEANRPTMDIIIKELESALNFQKDLIKNLQIPLKDIEVATEEFSEKNLCGSGRYWKAYKGELQHADANTTIVAKWWDNKFEDQFRTELDIQFKRKHKHIICLVGFCNEKDKKIIVYEHTSKGSLDAYLKHSTLKWRERLQICIDIASALEFLHEGDVMLNKVVHRDINSHNIFLNDVWDAKISNFELDSLSTDMKHINDDAYLDPQYKQGVLIGKSDIYSFGVILVEILCGGLAWVEGREGDKSQSLTTLSRRYYEKKKVDEMVFEGIKEQIVSQSLATFVDIAYQCLHEDGHKRPKASRVAIELKKALEFQEDFEVWERKLPREYTEIMLLSEKPDIYHTEKKKDIYKKLYNGILIAKNKVWFKVNENGEANKMISATTFSYENHESHKWRSLRKSRFRAVAQMLDISNLKIKITINTQFLSPDVAYGVYLVFKFCDPKLFPSTRMYINMEYKNGTETLHSYFATWRDDEWMMIELYRFVNHKDDVILKFLLDSFSRYYCRSGTIYIEGVEFRAIKNVVREDIKNLGEVQRPSVHEEIFKRSEPDNMDDKLYTSIELNGKKYLTLSAKEVLRNSSQLKAFHFKSSTDSRFQDVAELLPQQVFRINYKIETQMLSPFTEYTCYLVFKVSKKSCGLYCPVKVRDLLHRNKKENKIVYFRSPARLNQHYAFGVPKQREDGWMEVMVWNFNSKYNKPENNYIHMNLKLLTYEGTMSGLIVCGLEFRPM